MRTPSLLVATIACLSALATAEPDRPKFYFPRQVKRQVWNNLTGPLTTPARSPSLSLPRQDRTTTKRQSDSAPGADGIFPPNSAAGTGAAASTTDGVMTVVVESTTVVTDSGQAAAATSSVDNTVDTSDGAATTSSDGTITFGPSGVITPTPAAATTSDPIQADPAAATTSASAPTSTDPIVDSVLASVVSDLSSVVSSILPAPTTSAAVDSAAPTTTDGGAAVESAAPTTTDGITGPGTSVTPATTQDPLASVISQISAAVTSALGTSAPTTTDLGILSSIGSVLDTATDSITLPLVTPTPTLPTDNSAPTLPTDTLVPTQPPDTSGISYSAVPTGGPSSSIIITSGPGSAPTPTLSIIEGGTTASDNNTGIVVPTSAGTQAVITDTGVTATPTSLGESFSTGGAGSLTDSVTATQPAASVSSTDTPPLTSILPIGTDTASTAWLPATIVVQSSPIASDAIATTATGIATTLPQAISPPTGIPQTPADSTLIQIGFNYSLNYEFVVSNPNSSAQIFMFMPKGLAYGLSIREDQVIMNSLKPYDTQKTMGFITTLAIAWIPSNMVDSLKQSLHQALSPLYQNPDDSVYQLMQYINPTIPLIPGNQIDGPVDASGTGASPSATAGGGGNGVFNTDSQSSSPATRTTAAAAAMAAVGAAAAYGAAMFFIARRYKRRRSLHRRTSSVTSPSQMRFTGSPALMGGALMSGGRGTPGLQNGRESRGSGRSAGNSARTVEISAPMMAENSLGWN